MALTQRLEFRQSQSLVMTPQLMQAIKLLQLSNLDLSTFVEEELERNPLLERADNDGDPVESRQQVEAGSGPDGDSDGFAGSDDVMSFDSAGDTPGGLDGASDDWMNRDLGSRAEMEQTFDTPLDNVFSEEPADTATRAAQDAVPSSYTEWGGGASGNDDYNLEAFVAADVSLGDHLAEQLALAIPDAGRRLIGQYLIDLIDDTGYLPADYGQVAEQLGTTLENVDAVLAVVQTFDPPGIAARTLAECLALQLRDRNRFDPAMQALIDNLDLLARRDVAALKKV
ncbi:MAG: RNA polymerase sigma-54 factor, partial [Rhizobiaceae bacterium]